MYLLLNIKIQQGLEGLLISTQMLLPLIWHWIQVLPYFHSLTAISLLTLCHNMWSFINARLTILRSLGNFWWS